MKKYKISYGLAVFFTAGFLLSVRYFDGEGAGFLLVLGIMAIVAAIINFKFNR
jgi:hypothetical protein